MAACCSAARRSPISAAYVIQSKVAGTVIPKEFKERVIEAAGEG